MRRVCLVLIASLIGLWAPAPLTVCAQAPVSVVRAVLFYSPNCGHCHFIITEVLPPLFDRYGDRLQMVGIDVTQPIGQALFVTALEIHGIDPEYAGVPFLVIGDQYLFGDVDIPAQFPGLIEYYLSQAGIDWPDIPGLSDMLISIENNQEVQSSPTPGPTSTPEALILTGKAASSVGDRLAQDPAGNGLAILVLVGMLVGVGWSLHHFHRSAGHPLKGSVLWIIPVLSILGLGVASYLAYVEATHSEAVCGPIGDCNTVQQSAYARLFGILPIGVLGMVGYIMILLAWAMMSRGDGMLAPLAALALLVMTSLGTIFSIYLTFLEPFVIGATCAWCLSSAVIMTVLMLLSVPPGKFAVLRLIRRDI